MSISVRELHWTAGFLEGDGSFGISKSGSLVVTAAQVNRWPLGKLQTMFGGSIATTFQKEGANHRTLHRWTLNGVSGAGLMMTLYPLMYSKRKSQIRKVLEEWKNRPMAHQFKTHCPKGHEYTEENTRHHKGQRRCRSCQRQRDIERTKQWRSR